jgi:acetyl-CoA C-acetyltransferase
MVAGVDPRAPVLVGVGQFSNRVDRGAEVLEPVDLMAVALRRAEVDTGVASVLRGADSVRVLCELSWRYGDPGALVAARVGAEPAETLVTVMGGNYVQTLVNQTALDIAAGRRDLVLLCGGEAWRSRTRARRDGVDLGWTTQPEGTRPTTVFGDERPLNHEAEVARGVFLPVHLYPMFDVALRAHEGWTIDEHRHRIAALWSSFSEVAARNPNAWIQRAFTPEELATVTPDNRMVGFPYTKRLNSNNAVEQGAALIMCSAERADALGIPADRWVFLHGGSDAHDHWFVSERADLHSAPAIRVAGRAALDLAGIGVDDLAHVDLYSCFPSAVQIAARELGLGEDRPLTVTGGMSFAGGPWNNYVMHGIATMVDLLRADPDAFGLCTGNGGYLTKHAFGVYRAAPPAGPGFRHIEPQAEVDALPRRDPAPDHVGPVEIESYVVAHDRDGAPEQALVALLTPDGRRTWGTTDDAATMAAMVTAEHVGRSAAIDGDGRVTVT